MASVCGNHLKLSVFGQSHGEAVGMVLDGLPAGEKIDSVVLQAFLTRRAPGRAPWATGRQESDVFSVRSGLVDGVTCGAPLMAEIQNRDVRSRDYAPFADVPRPGHADYPAAVRWAGNGDVRGGGHSSGRLTAALCLAGGICMQILARRGILIGGHIRRIAGIDDDLFDPVELKKEQLLAPGRKEFPVLNDEAGRMMQRAIEQAAAENDSVGGLVEAGAVGLPAGLGEPLFDGVENRLSAAMFAVGGVRGVSFGLGFDASDLRGSQHNDPFCIRNGRIETVTNHAGGVLGGMTDGMPLLMNIAFKPTPSIGRPQQSVSLRNRAETVLEIRGRHDPCIVPRAVPVTEAVIAFVLADLLADAGLLENFPGEKNE